ncbi:MAG: tyrosine-type recombinase/integrase [Desulfobacula sp.]|nr:tyrosine-type recombinase/integrase [Desulfobacula sp.]MCF6247126.1 tyrosine-type recombinase/integrase [Desulfobacula sp.]
MTILELIQVYLKHLRVLGRSRYTIKAARYELQKLMVFMEQETAPTLDNLTNDILYEYQQELAFKISVKGKLLSLRTQAQRLGVIKAFTRFLKEQDYIIADPGEVIKLPKKPKRLPKVILNISEIKKIMEAANIRTNKGYRNRVILEILYDTAIRRSELAGIKINNLDLNSGFIHVRGKGDKDRVVPLNQRVCRLIENYIVMVRPEYLQKKDPGYLILNRWGQKMDPNSVWAVVKRCAYLAGIKKNVSTHTFRHTCATHMLKNGAPIRHIQEMLGHESLESTQIYTRVTINDLKKIHAKYHPGEQTS